MTNISGLVIQADDYSHNVIHAGGLYYVKVIHNITGKYVSGHGPDERQLRHRLLGMLITELMQDGLI